MRRRPATHDGARRGPGPPCAAPVASFVASSGRAGAWIDPEIGRAYAILDRLSAHRATDAPLLAPAALAGEPAPAIAGRSHVAAATEHPWLRRFDDAGPAGLEDKPRKGRPPTYARELAARGMPSMLLWVFAANPARRFYEALGGVHLGEQQFEIDGATLTEVAYGWRDTAPLRGT